MINGKLNVIADAIVGLKKDQKKRKTYVSSEQKDNASASQSHGKKKFDNEELHRSNDLAK